MKTPEQLLAKLYELRKDYQDNDPTPEYEALHHAFMFISYNMEAFKRYVREESDKEEAKGPKE
jgi:hypothetical protein